MFSRLNVRTKLLAMVLPVTAALIVVAGFGILARLDDRDAAQQQRDTLEVSHQTAGLIHELQLERLMAASNAAVLDPQTVGELDAQGTATDRASKLLIDTLDAGTLSVGQSEELARALDVLRSVPTATAEVRTGTERQTPLAVVDQYSRLIERAQRALSTVEVSNDSGGATTDAMSRRWLAQAIEAEAQLTATGTAFYEAPMSDDSWASMSAATTQLGEETELLFSTFGQYATPAVTDALTAARATDESRSSDAGIALLSQPPATFGEASRMPTTIADWVAQATSRNAQLVSIESQLLSSELDAINGRLETARFAVTWFAAAAAAAVLGAALLAFAISRSINGSLHKLTAAARTLSTDQVPALLESLKSPSFTSDAAPILEVDTGSKDEFAEVGQALSDLSNAIVGVATEQNQQLRRGISDIFVNLARRNQSLLDRQIQFIDRLETNEEDPDQLENLFRLDHLATRMRRNAESLLVLAGAEAPRRRARNVEIGDVVRVAIGEVEDFARVDLVVVEPAIALGAVAVDIAHLLAELMENGAQYSPPETTVDVIGRNQADGGYSIVITDHGVGMSEERLAQANELLKNPPPVGLALSRSLGFVVAGTLGQRHCIDVVLSAGIDGGVTAVVSLPGTLLAEPTLPTPQPETTMLPSRHEDGVVLPIRPGSLNTGAAPLPVGKGVPGPLPTPAFHDEPVGPAAFLAPEDLAGDAPERVVLFDSLDSFGPPTTPSASFSAEHVPTDAEIPSRLDDIVPSGERFDEGVYGLLNSPVVPSIPTPIVHQPTPDAATLNDEAVLPSLPQRRTLDTNASDAFASPLAPPSASTPSAIAPAAVAPLATPLATPMATPLAPPAPPAPAGSFIDNAPAPPAWSTPSETGWLPPVYHPPAGDDPAFLPPPASPVDDAGPGDVNPLALPKRQPGASAPASTGFGNDDIIAAPPRPAEGRSALSRYRSGLVTGRNTGNDPAAAQHEGEQQ